MKLLRLRLRGLGFVGAREVVRTFPRRGALYSTDITRAEGYKGHKGLGLRVYRVFTYCFSELELRL